MPDDKPSVGFIGIGLMGQPMTLRLLAAGYPVRVWNRNAGKLAAVIAAGARMADSPADLARKSDLVFMCVTDTAAVEAVVFGPGGITAGGTRGKVLVDFSSIKPDATRDMAARLRQEVGMGWVDAPVSGGVNGAEKGTLAIMAGGAAADIERVRPVVMNLCQRLTHMGPSGAGQITKLCNQIIVGCTMAVLAEAVNFAKHAGVDAAMLPEALRGGFADSLPLQLFAPRMVTHQFEPPIGHTHTILKDLDSASELARKVTAPLPMATAAAELMRIRTANGHAEACATSIITLYESD